MLFNSLEFLYIFLPITLTFFLLAEKFLGRFGALAILISSSLIFYGSWSISSVYIVIISIVFNYLTGELITRVSNKNAKGCILIISILVNLLVLFFFKYLIYSLSKFGLKEYVESSQNWFFQTYALPLGISFWTFQQINFNLERYNNKKDKLSFWHYLSIVLFFPHLVAGPIVRASELGPQVLDVGSRSRNILGDLSLGILIFSVGLFKKSVLADSIAIIPNGFYSDQGMIADSGFLIAWLASISYLLQLYFDFSGYCDMGMGLAKMFGFTFPINFNSPLKARSFVEFWRTWHITLTRFFTDTLHTPLAMSLTRKYGGLRNPNFNFLITALMPITFTFFLTGIWHGAGDQFIAFGILNGVFMAVGVLIARKGWIKLNGRLANALTFLLVSLVFVFFRAPKYSVGVKVVGSMLAPWQLLPSNNNFINGISANTMLITLFGLLIALLMPNLYELISSIFKPLGFNAGKKVYPQIKINVYSAIVASTMVLISIYFIVINGFTPFLYFQF